MLLTRDASHSTRKIPTPSGAQVETALPAVVMMPPRSICIVTLFRLSASRSGAIPLRELYPALGFISMTANEAGELVVKLQYSYTPVLY
jgi:hypothetical protein